MKLNWKNWSWLRIIRLVLGISFVGQAIDSKDWLFLPIGLFFLYQVITNEGCSTCETEQCTVSE